MTSHFSRDVLVLLIILRTIQNIQHILIAYINSLVGKKQFQQLKKSCTIIVPLQPTTA